MEQMDEWNRALAQLMWQVELGAVDALAEEPVDRYALPNAAPIVAAPAPTAQAAPVPSVAPIIAPPPKVSDAEISTALAAEVADLEALRAVMERDERCDLKKGARNMVFADGHPVSDLMIIGEAPGRDEDQAGRPFVGQAGQLLDKMFAAIGRDRGAETAAQGLYITNILPWRPPHNRDPSEEDIAMMVPFVRRHIALAQPKVIVLMGNIACQALLGQTGITKLRGTWDQIEGIPTMPMLHPAYLLRRPLSKAEAWADLKAVRAKLNEG